MRAAAESLALLSLSLAACAEATEIEALPPDESVEPPADEPVSDAAEPPNGNGAQY